MPGYAQDFRDGAHNMMRARFPFVSLESEAKVTRFPLRKTGKKWGPIGWLVTVQE